MQTQVTTRSYTVSVYSYLSASYSFYTYAVILEAHKPPHHVKVRITKGEGKGDEGDKNNKHEMHKTNKMHISVIAPQQFNSLRLGGSSETMTDNHKKHMDYSQQLAH